MNVILSEAKDLGCVLREIVGQVLRFAQDDKTCSG